MSEHDTKVAEECGKFIIKSDKFQEVILIDLISKVSIKEDSITIHFLKRAGVDPCLLIKDGFEETTWLYLKDFFLNTYPQIPAPGLSMEEG